MRREAANSILNASVNLLGFCLVVITSLHIANFKDGHLVDEAMMVVAVFLSLSALLSYVSVRQLEKSYSETLFRIGEFLFVSALFGILVSVITITFEYIK